MTEVLNINLAKASEKVKKKKKVENHSEDALLYENSVRYESGISDVI